MSKRILVETREGGRQLALLDDQSLLAYAEDDGGGAAAEQIYWGVADRLMKGMEACFVRLGPDAMGFLPFAECLEKPRSGDRLLVQVKKPPIGGKAPYLTADIALAGRFVILTPLTARCAVSKKITEEAERLRLLDAARRLAPPGMGLVMRTESADASDADMRNDLARLLDAWREILEKQKTAQAPCLLKGREDALSRLLRDEHGAIVQILADRPEALPPCAVPVTACASPFSLFNVRDKLHKSMQRRVWLPCGGYLVIDPTEALTVIDVNSGKYAGQRSGAESTFLKLNLEAAREIARLLRLRNIGGIVIIDFVDMLREESRAAVQAALEEALRDDPVKTCVHGFTALGLMEMTRKKT